MENHSIKNNQSVNPLLASKAAAAKAQATGGPQFASFLVFGTDNMNNTLSMNADQSKNDPIMDDAGGASYEEPHPQDRDTQRADRRDDDQPRERSDERDKVRDTDTRDTRSDDNGRDTQRNDDRAHDKRDDGPRQDARQDKDQNADKPSASKDQGSDKSAKGQNDESAAQNQDKVNSNADNVTDEAAANAFAQGAAAAAQVATDPALVAAAAAQTNTTKTNGPREQTVQMVQATNNASADAKGLFSQGWQSGGQDAKNGQQNMNSQQGLQQAQAGQNNTQTQNPQLQGQFASEAQRQAADLSKKIGQNQRATVNVNVTQGPNDAALQQAQNASAMAQATEDAKNPLAGAQKKGPQQPGAAVAQTNVQAGLVTPQNQLNPQVNQQAQQNQSFQNVMADSKGAATAAAKTQTVAQPQSIGSEVSQTTSQTQQNQQTQQAHEARQAQQNKPTYHASAKPEEISVEISKAAKAGHDRISIQLKPAELGRIEIQLDLSSGKVVTNIVAERPETLNMLRNDASQLSRALQEAGLNMGEMTFNLQQNGEGEQSAGTSGNGGNGTAQGGDGGNEEEILLASQADLLSQRAEQRAAKGGVDIQA